MKNEKISIEAALRDTAGCSLDGPEPHQREYWIRAAEKRGGVKVANGPTILTRGGRYFDLLDPFGSQIEITDIAYALGNICRFTGHCNRFYSVAEHSVWCCQLAAPELRFAALLHDAAEAYVGDVSRPLKLLLPEYKRIEKQIEAAIAARFKAELAGARLDDPRIKAIDASILKAERLQLMPEVESDWNYGAETSEVNIRLLCYRPELATAAFLDHWRGLGGTVRDEPA